MSEPAGPDPGSLTARPRPRRRVVHAPHVDRPRPRLESAPHALAASRGHHPPDSRQCHICGFAPPSRPRLADEVRRLPAIWTVALTAGGPAELHRAAQLRDEIHGVTNRVTRLVAQPGARVLPVTVPFPSTASGAAISVAQVLHVLRAAANRLVDVVRTLREEDWDIGGTRVDTERSVIVHELLLVPLHHSHRDITLVAADRATLRLC